MFGQYFGNHYFGDPYFGPSAGPAAPVVITPVPGRLRTRVPLTIGRPRIDLETVNVPIRLRPWPLEGVTVCDIVAAAVLLIDHPIAAESVIDLTGTGRLLRDIPIMGTARLEATARGGMAYRWAVREAIDLEVGRALVEKEDEWLLLGLH